VRVDASSVAQLPSYPPDPTVGLYLGPCGGFRYGEKFTVVVVRGGFFRRVERGAAALVTPKP